MPGIPKNPPGFYYIKTTVSLRLGHASVLAVHRTAIHYLGAATLPLARRAFLAPLLNGVAEKDNGVFFR